VLDVETWADAAALWDQARGRGVAGLILKRLGSSYATGLGEWWAWPVAPFTVSAVLMYAQRGVGSYASLYSEYTFGVWDREAGAGDEARLVPFAKTSAGLTEKEIRKIDAFVRRNVIEKFGSVRTVRPELVFELAFETVEVSTRHKSGLVARLPRVLRRVDKTIAEVGDLQSIRAVLKRE
jgi:DNA ligase 1